MSRLEAIGKLLYQHTRPMCGTAPCGAIQHCCDRIYCDAAGEFAAYMGQRFEPTGHPDLPYMGANGCIVPPHLRPICVAHTCQVASTGRGPNSAWTRRYFELRERYIQEVENTGFNSLDQATQMLYSALEETR